MERRNKLPGNASGGARAAETNKKKYGKDFYKIIGARGGKATGYKGFATNPKMARLAGAVGGRNSKRGKDPMRAERVKKALTLYREEGKSVEQIAKEMDLSKATINNYLKEL